jgi:hypothetical protein
MWLDRYGSRPRVDVAIDEINEAASWGILLADLADEICQAHAQKTGESKADLLVRLKSGFDIEWRVVTGGTT